MPVPPRPQTAKVIIDSQSESVKQKQHKPLQTATKPTNLKNSPCRVLFSGRLWKKRQKLAKNALSCAKAGHIIETSIRGLWLKADASRRQNGPRKPVKHR
jgi:hypothetical protein